jgi:predicted RNA methylase
MTAIEKYHLRIITAIVNSNIRKSQSDVYDFCIGTGPITVSALIDGTDTVYCYHFITVYNQQYLDKLFQSNTILSSITIV